METLQSIALIIEDDVDISIFLSEFLKLNNFKTVSAGTIRAIKDINLDLHPAVIFVDNKLPDGFGFDLIPVLRRNYPDSKIIAMTAQDIYLNKQKAIESGADYFMEKPFSLEQILKYLN